MVESKQQLEKALIVVGESLKMKKATEFLIKNVGIQQLES